MAQNYAHKVMNKRNWWKTFNRSSVHNDYTGQQREKNGTTVICFLSTNSTVYLTGMHFSGNIFFYKNIVFKFQKSSHLAFFNSKLLESVSERQSSAVYLGSD